jgi:glucose-1-phosphatase
MVKAIIFDLGNVLVKIDNSRVLMQFSRYLKDRYELKDLERLIYLGNHEPENETEVFFHNIQEKFHLGKIGKDELYKQMTTKLRFTEEFTFDNFCMIWPARFKRIEGSINILKELNNYRRYLLSDTNELDAAYLMKHYGDIFKEFDRVFFSHETGVNKSSEKAWQNVIKHSQTEPGTHIFIDDRKDYVEAAEQLGMQGIVFRDATDLRNQLIKSGCELIKEHA